MTRESQMKYYLENRNSIIKTIKKLRSNRG